MEKGMVGTCKRKHGGTCKPGLSCKLQDQECATYMTLHLSIIEWRALGSDRPGFKFQWCGLDAFLNIFELQFLDSESLLTILLAFCNAKVKKQCYYRIWPVKLCSCLMYEAKNLELEGIISVCSNLLCE